MALNRDKLVADSITRLIDAQFSLGDLSRGWDCLNSLKSFYVGCGVDFPTAFEDYTEQNYPEKWKEDVGRAKDAMMRFLKSLGKPIHPNYILRGDLLLFETVASKPPPAYTAIIKPGIERLSRLFPYATRYIQELVEGKRPHVFPGIYLGNGHIFMVFDIGCKVVPYRFFEKFCKEARRLIPDGKEDRPKA
jgi:hypothetical protein